MYRRLKNFAQDPDQEDVYRQLLKLDPRQFFESLLEVDLHPTLRLIAYLRSFNILNKNDVT